MASLTRLIEQNLRNTSKGVGKAYAARRLTSSGGASGSQESAATPTASGKVFEDEEEFRVLNLRATQQAQTRKRMARKADEVTPPRSLKMPTDQDWTAVWPGPRSFHPASVPLPIRQGYTVKGAPPPSKYANAELMKIPNFLHLTPPAIRQQCEAIKKFCTPWPKGLETAEKCTQHFPIEIVSTDYCHGLPTIRHPEARRVTLKLKLSHLKFDKHARDKFLRLVGQRYDAESDILTIVADRCPLRKQNYDYAMYLLTACYHEAFITEPWEQTKSEADMERYYFERNKSKVNTEAILNWGSKESGSEGKKQATPEYVQSLEQLINEGENEQNLGEYKKHVLQMLGMSK